LDIAQRAGVGLLRICGMTTTIHRPIAPKRILVVEDEPLVAQTIKMALAVDGHSVEVAKNAEEALVLFNPEAHDLVITDFSMGKMDGLELARVVKERCPGKPVILLTAYAEKAGGMGAVSNIDVLISKPFSVPELLQALRKLFSTA
jgi:CheY-like chemotaxis protein